MEKRAQQRLYRLNPDALFELEGWARHMMHLWNQRFDALERVLEAEKKHIETTEMERRSTMAHQQTHDSIDEQASSPYGSYQGGQQDARQQEAISYEQPLREGPAGKVYPPLSDNKNMLRLIWFVVAMVALLAFAVVCLVIVGGTAGWISFCAASFTIMVVASTAIAATK